MNFYFLSVKTGSIGNAAFLTDWSIEGFNGTKDGNGVESLVKALRGLRGAFVYCNNLAIVASYIQHFCVLYNIETDCFARGDKVFYLSFPPRGAVLRGAENIIPWRDLEGLLDLEEYIGKIRRIIKQIGADKTAQHDADFLTISSIAFHALEEVSNVSHYCPRPSIKQYNMIQNAYRGGYVFSKKSDQIFENVRCIDNNGLYPYIYKNIPIPCGSPIYTAREDVLARYPFFIARIRIDFCANDGEFPIIGQKVTKTSSINYKEDGFEDIWVTNYDLDLIKRTHWARYELLCGFGYRVISGIFSPFVDAITPLKYDADKDVRKAAKFMLNTPSGKFAQGGRNETLKYYIDKEGVLRTEKIDEWEDPSRYGIISIACAITSAARSKLLDTARTVGSDRVLYMDTDSIKHTGETPKSIEINPQKLGAWKDEGTADLFKTIAPKRYAEYKNGEYSITAAAIPENVLKRELHHGEKLDKKTALEYMQGFQSGKTIKSEEYINIVGGKALQEMITTL